MSDTSTKRAEEVAYNLQLSGISGSTWSATEVEASNMLRALAAENEKLRAALRELIYETTHLSPQEDDGSHRCTITGETLRKARMALLALGEKE